MNNQRNDVNNRFLQLINIKYTMEQGMKQVKKSYVQFNEKLMETNTPIHKVRINNEKLQKNSRLDADHRAQERLASIQQEAVLANKKNTALEIKWSELKEHEECQSLHQAIQQQKESFQLIINAKDKLIKQFQNQLKKKDDLYSKTLKSQSEDIKVLVAKMRDQYFELRDQSLKQLDDIQQKFQEQRRKYIENAQKEVENCFQKHIKMEHDFAENRRKAEEDFEKKIDQLRIEGMQTYTNTKIKMENDIQNLQKCYEQMKGLYQLNTEKLDYNLKVLKEKKDENSRTHEDSKKKLQVLNMKLRHLKDQYDQADQIFKDQNKLHTTEYKRITRQFKQLQRKFKHFQKADLQRYNQIQSMNEAEVHKLKEKIIKCDIVIHNQQLGMEWAGTPQEGEKQKQNVVAAIAEEEEDTQVQLVVDEEKLMQLIELLIEEGDFIFDDKMREELEKAGTEQKLKEKLDILKKTLQIDSTDQMNLFIDEMANKCKYVSEKQKYALLEAKLKREQEAKEEEQRQAKKKRRGGQQKKVEKPLQPPEQQQQRVDLKSDFKVDPVLIVDFLVDWMNNKDERKKILQRTAKRSLKQLSQREKKERIAKEGKKYWEKLTQVLPERTFRIWKVLEKSLTKYYQLLLSRQKLIDETGEMHNQNQQLKNLLNQYLQINHELIIPPTRLMEREN